MQLARFLNTVFKKDGFILIDANSKNYIIGTPESETPIKVKILNKKLHYRLLFHPDLKDGTVLRPVLVKPESGDRLKANSEGETPCLSARSI